MYKVVFNKRVFKFLEKHKWEKIIFKLEKSVNILKQNPYKNILDIKKLKEGLKKSFVRTKIKIF